MRSWRGLRRDGRSRLTLPVRPSRAWHSAPSPGAEPPRSSWHGAAAPSLEKPALKLPKSSRRRDKRHLDYVSSKPCLVCGRAPSDAHHLRFAEPRELGRVSDEFTVPLCRIHHRELHGRAERAWWAALKID